MGDLELVLNYAEVITWSVVAFFAIWKIGIPVSKIFIDKAKLKLGISTGVEQRLDKLETNHLQHLQYDVDFLKTSQSSTSNRLDHIEDDISNIRERLGRIEGKLNGNLFNK